MKDTTLEKSNNCSMFQQFLQMVLEGQCEHDLVSKRVQTNIKVQYSQLGSPIESVQVINIIVQMPVYPYFHPKYPRVDHKVPINWVHNMSQDSILFICVCMYKIVDVCDASLWRVNMFFIFFSSQLQPPGWIHLTCNSLSYKYFSFCLLILASPSKAYIDCQPLMVIIVVFRV